MSHLPVIVGFGGINPAGRSSFHHAYRRLIIDKLEAGDRDNMLTGLATLTGRARWQDGQLVASDGSAIDSQRLRSELAPQLLNDTLIRKIHPDWFDIDHTVFNAPASISPAESGCSFQLRKRHLPSDIPPGWQILDLGKGMVEVQVNDSFELLFKDTRASQVRAAGQLPTGFRPGELYQSRNHPRNLQMTVFGASDAINSVGIPWEQIRNLLPPDQVAVYAGNSIGQLDDYGFGGLLKSPVQGKRTTSKQMPLGYGQMPADFVNAYLLGNLGATGSSLGACATFLYNLRNGVDDIRSGRRRLVLVGGSDAPVTPEIIEGFRAMGALAEDKDLLALDGVSVLSDEHYRRTSRPFANNCGFTMGEATQFVVLCDDALALELGADIFGSVPDVFINADGHKKSISAPGVGNYITMGRAASLVRSLLGDAALKQRSFVQAHGTSTPQNRVTESHVINETAKAFGISNWPVAAIKCYLGHSQGTAGGDQLAISLGVWRYGYIPGITTLDQVADDVHRSNLRFERDHIEVGRQGIDAVLLNSKGFGGNNASAPVFSPEATLQLMRRKHGMAPFKAYEAKLQEVRASAGEYDQEATRGLNRPTYLFGQNVLSGEDMQITDQEIRIPGYTQAVQLDTNHELDDYCDP
ncbi:beta-ketoacyl synthase [Motiliproteus sediminis]|uniref:beta-ketoacyl synthase n=1 Tax=Motiliproteus sediminis TaxID=1468178 RepID=UPI001AEF6FEE|nr:beta-ketoacyl synthase [Motiliproteus sediminis]